MEPHDVKQQCRTLPFTLDSMSFSYRNFLPHLVFFCFLVLCFESTGNGKSHKP